MWHCSRVSFVTMCLCRCLFWVSCYFIMTFEFSIYTFTMSDLIKWSSDKIIIFTTCKVSQCTLLCNGITALPLLCNRIISRLVRHEITCLKCVSNIIIYGDTECSNSWNFGTAWCYGMIEGPQLLALLYVLLKHSVYSFYLSNPEPRWVFFLLTATPHKAL